VDLANERRVLPSDGEASPTKSRRGSVGALFDELDADGSGALDQGEIRQLAHKLGRFRPGPPGAVSITTRASS
jgi:hypothetical protein